VGFFPAFCKSCTVFQAFATPYRLSGSFALAFGAYFYMIER
jgi:hypothetical protein